MRLSQQEQQAVSQAIHEADMSASIYLFGSRADDEARGGDIDLLVLSKKIKLLDKLSILSQLHRQLGERKIDIAVFPNAEAPFPQIAIQTGVLIA
jgi:predicted nucleotidyltransferase